MENNTSIIGKKIGNYIVSSLVGEGSMGQVYLGEHPKIGRKVAIKVLISSLSSDPEMSNRFLSEARAVNKINHPNIVEVFDFGKLDDDRLYLIMEYLEGKTLEDIIRTCPLSCEETIKLFSQIAKALKSAHDNGIIHRDLKPENIFIEQNNNINKVKILDFGVAKLLEPGMGKAHKTETGLIMGTPSYMSPEQAAGNINKIKNTSDIYSVAIIIYEMLTGKLPIHDDLVPKLLVKHICEQPTPIFKYYPDFPINLWEVLKKALAKQPYQRFQSIEAFFNEFKNEFEQFQEKQKLIGDEECEFGDLGFFAKLKLKKKIKNIKNEINNTNKGFVSRLKLAKIYRQLGNNKLAQKHYIQVAKLYLDNGKKKQAQAVCNQVLQFYPHNKQLKSLLKKSKQQQSKKLSQNSQSKLPPPQNFTLKPPPAASVEQIDSKSKQQIGTQPKSLVNNSTLSIDQLNESEKRKHIRLYNLIDDKISDDHLQEQSIGAIADFIAGKNDDENIEKEYDEISIERPVLANYESTKSTDDQITAHSNAKKQAQESEVEEQSTWQIPIVTRLEPPAAIKTPNYEKDDFDELTRLDSPLDIRDPLDSKELKVLGFTEQTTTDKNNSQENNNYQDKERELSFYSADFDELTILERVSHSDKPEKPANVPEELGEITRLDSGINNPRSHTNLHNQKSNFWELEETDSIENTDQIENFSKIKEFWEQQNKENEASLDQELFSKDESIDVKIDKLCNAPRNLNGNVDFLYQSISKRFVRPSREELYPNNNFSENEVISVFKHESTLAGDSQEMAKIPQKPNPEQKTKLSDTDKFFQRSDFLRGINPFLADELKKHLEYEKYDKDQIIFSEGDKGDSLFIIKSGQANVVKYKPDGSQTIINVLKSSDIFGELSMLVNHNRHASIITKTEVELVKLPKDKVLQLVQEYPSFIKVIKRFYMKRLQNIIFRNIPFFDIISNDDKKKFLGNLHFCRFGRGSKIIHQNAKCGGFFLVLYGKIEIIRKNKNEEILLEEINEGGYLGEMSLLRQETSKVSVVSPNVVEMIQIPAKNFYSIIGNHPMIWSRLKEKISNKKLLPYHILTGEGSGFLSF
ncbi:MAG: serine/threonine-protein kinase [Myxococcota bacterium]